VASDGTVDLLRRYYDRIDGRAFDRAEEWVDELRDFFADGATIRAVNQPPADWRGLFVQDGALARAVDSASHEILTVVEDGEGNVAAELAVTYVLKRGGTVTLPGSLFAVIRDGRFTEQHMYVDFAPVFRAARKGA
jgi:ketosteroid isomerase-like protein